MSNYNKTSNTLPPEGVVVDTISENGQVQKLIRKGSLYFLDDMSMYVYYVPILWRIV